MKTIKAFTDSITSCEYCGRTNLKGTFLLVDEYNNEFYYGSECGAKAAGISKSEFKAKTNLPELIKNIVNEASYMGLSCDLENNIQILIAKYKLRLPVWNAFYNKETQSHF